MGEEARDVGAWQRRLEDTFEHDGVVGGRVLPVVMKMERDAGERFVAVFHGHRILADCFLDFFAVTLDAAAQQLGKLHEATGAAEPFQEYRWTLTTFLTLFRGFRASEVLSLAGYPLEGYALQRNQKEFALEIGAVAGGVTSWAALRGTAGVVVRTDANAKWTEAEAQLVHASRLNEQRRVRRLMVGEDSGLSQLAIDELEQWERLFNRQVHGSQFTIFGEAGRWMFREGEPFSVGPRPSMDDYAMFMCRFNEVAWMTLRALPYLQIPGYSFGDAWGQKWAVLDESVRFAVEGLSNLGKKIALAFLEMMDVKFGFAPTLHYSEVGSN